MIVRCKENRFNEELLKLMMKMIIDEMMFCYLISETTIKEMILQCKENEFNEESFKLMMKIMINKMTSCWLTLKSMIDESITKQRKWVQ